MNAKLDVAAWLRRLGLEQYEQAFRENDIDSEVVARLTGEDLRDLGVISVGHRRKLLDAIAALDGAVDLSFDSPLDLATSSGHHDVSVRLDPPEAERRHLTILFCDLVDSTTLARRLDPEEYGGIIAVFQEACALMVTRFDGFLAKYMGDGVLAYFGYPQAHEDEASRAVRAGLSIVEEVARLALPKAMEPLRARVGIATGLVVVGALIGEGSAREQSVAGDTPNLAARLQTLAPPGGVVIAPSTRRLLGSEFNLADLGPQDIKGFPEPISAWRVLGPRAVETRFEAHSSGMMPLIGRTEELGILVRSWELAKHGEGQTVLLSGEPGIGKSRLARGLLDHIQPEPHARVQYQCSPFFSNSPLQPFIDQMENEAGFRTEDTSDERLTKLEGFLARSTDAAVDVAPGLAAMLSIATVERYPSASLDPERERELIIDALITFLTSKGRSCPLLVVAEDVHWGDPTSLQVLDQLAARIASHRVLLLVTFRPELRFEWQARPNASFISLGRLARRQTTELAKGIAGNAGLPEEVLGRILDRTDGVPLFIEEFTKAVLESGFRAEGASGTGDRSRLTCDIPATLHDSLVARLDRLPAAKAAAQQAAVIGREFSYRMLAAISSQSEPELREAVRQLVFSGLMFTRGSLSETTYTFKHALLRDAAYESLLKSRRQELHARIAALLEEDYPDVTARQPELVAHHFSEAQLPARAIPLWQLAADNATRRQAHHEAIAHCTRGLAMLGLVNDEKQREHYELRLQVRLGKSAVSANGWGAAEVGKALYRARDLCTQSGEDQLLHPILAGLFVFHVFNGELVTAENFGGELLSLGDVRNDRIAQVDGHKTLTNVCYKLGKFREAQEHLDQGMSLYYESPWPEVTVEQIEDPGPHLLSHGSCALWALGHPDRARQAADDAIALGRDHGHHLSLANAVYMAGHLAELMEDWIGVQKANDDTLAIATEWRLSGLQPIVARRERLVAVALHCDPGQMEFKRRHPQPGFARSLHDGVLARAFGRQGDPEEGLRIIGESLAWVNETSSRFFDAELYRIRAELLMLTGRPDQAELSYNSALEVAREQSARMWELKAASDLARMMSEQGRRAEAHHLLAPIVGWFAEGISTRELQIARSLLDALRTST